MAASCGHYALLDILQISLNKSGVFFFKDVPQKFRCKPIINSLSVAPTLQDVMAATLIEIFHFQIFRNIQSVPRVKVTISGECSLC